MKFTFRGFSGGMPTLRLTFLERQRTIALCFSSFLRTRTLGITGGTGVEGQSLTAEDQLFILMQAALYLTATRGFAAPEAQNLLRARRALVSFA